MTKKTNTNSVGPVINAISSRAGQPIPLRPLRIRRPAGGGAAAAPPPALVIKPELDMMWQSLGPLRGGLDRIDDVLRGALAGQQVNHGGVERIADVLSVDRVEPLGNERGLAVGSEH